MNKLNDYTMKRSNAEMERTAEYNIRVILFQLMPLRNSNLTALSEPQSEIR